MGHNLIELKNVSATINNTRVFQNISCTIPTRSLIAIQGPSGSGKTTLVKLILELLLPEKGWQVAGKIERFPGLRIGYVNQDAPFHLFANFVYEEFFAIGKPAIQTLLAEMECEHLLEQRSLELSQGEKTIVAILRALSANIQLLILDEVMVNLSHSKRQLLQRLINNFKQQGGAIIVIEHNRDYLEPADRIINLTNGVMAKKMSLPSNSQETLTTIIPKSNLSDSLYINNLQNKFICKSITKPINLTLNNQDVLTITGDNGSGKTTFLEIIAGSKKADQGTIYWNKKELRHLRDRRDLVAIYTKESIHQFLTNKVKDELAWQQPQVDPQQNQLIELFNLAPLLDRNLTSLSFGEKQRIAIILRLISNARILLFDEPTYGMDESTTNAFITALQLLRNQQKIILIASHDLQLLAKCTRINFEL